jgi:hypothetical protein
MKVYRKKRLYVEGFSSSDDEEEALPRRKPTKRLKVRSTTKEQKRKQSSYSVTSHAVTVQSNKKSKRSSSVDDSFFRNTRNQGRVTASQLTLSKHFPTPSSLLFEKVNSLPPNVVEKKTKKNKKQAPPSVPLQNKTKKEKTKEDKAPCRLFHYRDHRLVILCFLALFACHYNPQPTSRSRDITVLQTRNISWKEKSNTTIFKQKTSAEEMTEDKTTKQQRHIFYLLSFFLRGGW